MEKSDVRFDSSSHLSKQVSNSITLTGRAGMAFIRFFFFNASKILFIKYSNILTI